MQVKTHASLISKPVQKKVLGGLHKLKSTGTSQIQSFIEFLSSPNVDARLFCRPSLSRIQWSFQEPLFFFSSIFYVHQIKAFFLTFISNCKLYFKQYAVRFEHMHQNQFEWAVFFKYIKPAIVSGQYLYYRTRTLRHSPARDCGVCQYIRHCQNSRIFFVKILPTKR